jgi:hypothetical protein
MKDVVIREKTIRREALILAVCVALTILMNLVSIMVYKTPWSELYGAWFSFKGLMAILVFVALFYGAISLLRLCWFGARRLLCKTKSPVPQAK